MSSCREHSLPRTLSYSPTPRSPRRHLRQERPANSSSSAPSSPTRQTLSIRAGYGYPLQPQSAQVGKTFWENATPNDSMHDHDDGDPHDLSFPTRHFPRASMVDNLVMSLDQFSPNPDTFHGHGQRAAPGHPKGHYKSSSVVGQHDLRNEPLRETPSAQSQSTADDARVTETEPDLRSVDEEGEPLREKLYNAQRAMQTTKPVSSKVNHQPRGRSGSNSSSIDLGYLASYAGRLGAPGNRRSQSFDFGSVRPKPPTDTIDMTTTPALYRSIDNLNAPGITTSSQSMPRRNSGKSGKANHRKGRSGTIGAGNTRATMESPQPQPSTRTQTFDANDSKAASIVHGDTQHTPRAGFFRRVFGSSNKNSIPPSSYPSAARLSYENTRPGTPVARAPKQTPTDPTHNKENQPSITKKPSSFFRRRKKSIAGGVPPPLPLTLNNNFDNTKIDAGASSPVSSLRAFMVPYLGEGTSAISKHNRGSSLQSTRQAEPAALQTVPPHRNALPDNGMSGADLQQVSTVDRGLQITASNVVSSPTSDERTVRGTQDMALATNTSPSAAYSTPKSPIEPANQTQHEVKAATPSLDQLRASPSTSQAIDEHKMGGGSSVKFKHTDTPFERDSRSNAAMIKLVPQSSGSDTSDYRSAPSTPLVSEVPEVPDRKSSKSPAVHVSHPSMSQPITNDDMDQARKVFDNTDEQVNHSNAGAWLGDGSNERERVRAAYMSLFDWTNFTILAALRNLCLKLTLRGETQQMDRILDAFATRWCECNANHGFKSVDVVHTLCYSILLLNTDLHMADIVRKMTKSEFVRNAMDTIRENMGEQDHKPAETTKLHAVRTDSNTTSAGTLGPSTEGRCATAMSTTRTNENLSREESHEDSTANQSGPLVEAPYLGPQSGWESQIESVLKDFYAAISKEPLPLFGIQLNSKLTPQQSTNNLSTLAALRRTPSTISKSTSDTRGRYIGESRSLGARWISKARSRPRLGTSQGFASSRTSIDDQSSAWSPSMSSTWSKVSLNKTLTSMSVESFGPEHMGGGYQSSIGFANALSQAIIRDEQMDSQADDTVKAVPMLEDESLELHGAPWAKEGILKHKCHLDGPDKRSKDRNWNDCFAVIEKGWMRIFSFSMTAKSLRNKARNQKAGGVVGGGNWQDNAEEVWKFMLRHTIASSLPPPGYSKQRPYVWALSLPNGAVHLFSVGTPDIVKEFVSTANFWSARLSKEPMTGGVSSMEYGWSDSVVNRAVVTSDSHPGFHASSPRPSTQLSMRSSMDHGSVRPRLPGDKVHISEWVPPQQSLMASQLLEVDQLKALQAYVKNVEDELQKHNEHRSLMLVAFSARHPNSQRAMTNWEKKSSYLLREIVKFRTYIDALQSAQTEKDKVNKMKEEEQLSRRVEQEAL